MTPGPGPEIEAYLAELVARLRAAAGERLVGAWLFGSAALGDFDAARSDLDVQAVSTVTLARHERERLAAVLSHEALPCPVRGLEFVLYAREGLQGAGGPAFQLNLNTGPGMERHIAFDPADDPGFWFVLDVAIGREAGRALTGPPAAEAFPAPPRELVLRAAREALAWFREHDAEGAATVLAACRAWAWAEDGRWLPKGDAAHWAAGRLEDGSVVEAALVRRSDPAAPAPDQAGVAAIVERAGAVLATG